MTRRGMAILAVVCVLGGGCAAPAEHGAAPEGALLQRAVVAVKSERDGTPHPPPAVERVARRAALRFIRAYLRFTYGRPTSNRRLHELAPVAPIVPPDVRRRHPRIVALRLEWAGPTIANALATINDGASSYPVAIRLARHHGGFRVIAIEP
jgi:hypothetical protein